MTLPLSTASRSPNRLLAALPPEDYQRLLPSMELVPLKLKDVLYEPNEPAEYVYFPLQGVASMLAVMEDETLVEVGTVGNEGMVGIQVFLGTKETSSKAFYQIPGEAMRMKAETLQQKVSKGGPLMYILQRYTQALFVMLAQHTACNRLHSLQQRAARWLLTARDCVPSDEFPLTQAFLSQVLGVRRAEVNEVMREFEDEGWLNYQRGIITMLDRSRLEKVSCACYSIIKAEYDRMFT